MNAPVMRRRAHVVLLLAGLLVSGAVRAQQPPPATPPARSPLAAAPSPVLPSNTDWFDAADPAKVAAVRTSITHGKTKRQGRFEGQRSDWKKAWVRLRDGEKVPDFLEGA